MIVAWSLIGLGIGMFLLTVLFGAPYVPTRRRDLQLGFDELYALTSRDVLVDIGSGDGAVLREAASRGATAIGYEINPLLVLLSRLLSRRQKLVTVHWSNYYRTDLPRGVTIVYVFGEGYHIRKIENWLTRQVARLGTDVYVMSYGFTLPNQTVLRQQGAYRLYRLEALQPQEAQV